VWSVGWLLELPLALKVVSCYRVQRPQAVSPVDLIWAPNLGRCSPEVRGLLIAEYPVGYHNLLEKEGRCA